MDHFAQILPTVAQTAATLLTSMFALVCVDVLCCSSWRLVRELELRLNNHKLLCSAKTQRLYAKEFEELSVSSMRSSLLPCRWRAWSCGTTSLGGGVVRREEAHCAHRESRKLRETRQQPHVGTVRPSSGDATDMSRVIRYRDGSSNYMCVQPRKDLQN